MLDSYQIDCLKNKRRSILSTTDCSLTVEEQAVFYIYEDLDDIKNKFVDVAFRLVEADRFGYYKKFGYETIVDFAEHLFDIKKSTTYALIHIGKYYCDGMQLKEQYKGFSKSQLEEMTHMPIYLEGSFKPEMTIQDMRDYKKALNGNTYYKGIFYNKPLEVVKAYREDLKLKVQTSGKEEVKVDDVKDKPIQLEEPKQPITDKDVSDCLKNIDKLIKPDKKVRLERLMSNRTHFKHYVSALLEKRYSSDYVEVKMGGKKQNLSVFLGCLAGNVYDCIEELIKG